MSPTYATGWCGVAAVPTNSEIAGAGGMGVGGSLAIGGRR